MPLTQSEIAFLGQWMAEYVDIRTGPAWSALREHGIRYTDIIWLMEAYQIVDPPRLVRIVTDEGESVEVLQFGRETNSLPECPWADAGAARWRNDELEVEVQAFRSTYRRESGG